VAVDFADIQPKDLNLSASGSMGIIISTGPSSWNLL